MRPLVILAVFLVLYDETSASRSEDFEVAGNVTVTLCPELHLCQNMGCGTSWIRNSACQCDWVCEFFDDCCMDFTSVCSTARSEVWDSFNISQFECISQTVQGTSRRSSVTRDFWMVSHCPYAAEASQNYEQIRENCVTTNNSNPLTLIPVTDASNITFRNIYCALCHGRPTSELVAWRLNASCRNPIPQNTSYAVLLNILWNDCSHFLELPAVEVSGPATRRPCLPSLISTCLQHNQNLLSLCRNFTAVVKASDGRSLYRNPACFAACKGSLIYSLDCPTETSQMVYDQMFPEIMQITTTTAIPSPTTVSTSIQESTAPSVGLQDISSLLHEFIAPSYMHNVQVASSMDTISNSSKDEFYTLFWQPQVALSVILDFNSDDQGQEQCQEGDLFDPFSQTCLSPQCEEGLEYIASEQRCEPVIKQPLQIEIYEKPEPKTDDTLRCLGNSNQGTGVFLMVWTASESTNLTNNSSNTEAEYKNRQQCIRDLLDVNLTSTPKVDHPYSGTLSQFAFTILVDVFLEDDHKATRNDTEFVDSISRQEAVALILVDIENKLEESAKTGVSQCGIQTLQLVQYCSGKQLNPHQSTLCSQVTWLPLENDTQVRVSNQTVWAFDSSYNTWHRLQHYNIRIQYSKQGSFFKKLGIEIGPCSEAPNNSCSAFVKLSESQFSLLDKDTDEANGSLIFHQTGEILEPGDFTRTKDGQIRICVTKVLQNGTQFFNFNNAQGILSTVGLVISVVAGSFSLVTYLVFPSLHSRTRKAIMGMVTSLITAQTLLLLSGIAAINVKACMTVAVMGHFLWLASLTWTNVLAFLLWNTFVTKNPSPSRNKIAVTSKVNILSFSYALGVPLAIVAVCLIIHFCARTDVGSMYNDHAPCWIHSGTINLAVFGAPMALFLVINIFLFGQTVWAIRSSHRKAAAQFSKGRDSSFLKQRGKELFIYIRMASLMGFTWVFGFTAAFSGEEALWYLFIILNSLQGFFIFLSFTFNGQVKTLWMKKLLLVRRSVLTKTSNVTNKSKTTTSSISAGVAASEMSSNDTPTADNNCYEASSQTSSRFKMALRRLKPKSSQRSEPSTDERLTKPSQPVEEDESSFTSVPSGCHASLEYEEVIPGRCPQTRDNKKGFWHKLHFPRPRHTTPSSQTAEQVIKIKEDTTSSLAGPSVCRESSAYEDVIPGRCLEPKVEKTQDTSLKSAENVGKSNSDEFLPRGKGIPPRRALLPPCPKPKLPHVCLEDDVGQGKEETPKQAPKIPFKIPMQPKPSVPEKTTKCLRPSQNADEQFRPMNIKEQNHKSKPATPPRVNPESKTEDDPTTEKSYHNLNNHTPELTDKKTEDSDKKVPLTKPLPPPRSKPSLQGIFKEVNGAEHPKPEVNMSPPKLPATPFLRSNLKGGDSVNTPAINSNLVVTSPKPPVPLKIRVNHRNALESRDESGWHDVIGQIKGQSALKSN